MKLGIWRGHRLVRRHRRKCKHPTVFATLAGAGVFTRTEVSVRNLMIQFFAACVAKVLTTPTSHLVAPFCFAHRRRTPGALHSHPIDGLPGRVVHGDVTSLVFVARQSGVPASLKTRGTKRFCACCTVDHTRSFIAKPVPFACRIGTLVKISRA